MNHNDQQQESTPSAEYVRELLPHTEWLSGRDEEMLNLVTELCNVNSGTFNIPGVKQVAEILMREFSCLGGEIKQLPVEPMLDVNDGGEETSVDLGPLLQIVKRPEVRPRVLLCIHMDTVYGSENKFQVCEKNPDGTINGPGVADAKGGLVVMLYALKAIEQSPLSDQIGWEVIINPDEELGSPGSENFLKQRAAEADIGLLFEPALPDGTLVSTRKGVGNFSFVVRGKSVHSGREFQNGRNAIVACCELMNDIHAMNTSSDMTFNVGRLRGGQALNVVPDLAIGRVNVRVGSVEQMNYVEGQFKGLVGKYQAKDGITVELHGRFTSPPKENSPALLTLQRRIELCGAAINRKIGWRSTGGASDGNKFAAAGLANVDTLGPRGGAIHSENEYMIPESLVESAKLTALTMLSLVE